MDDKFQAAVDVGRILGPKFKKSDKHSNEIWVVFEYFGPTVLRQGRVGLQGLER